MPFHDYNRENEGSRLKPFDMAALRSPVGIWEQDTVWQLEPDIADDYTDEESP